MRSLMPRSLNSASSLRKPMQAIMSTTSEWTHLQQSFPEEYFSSPILPVPNVRCRAIELFSATFASPAQPLSQRETPAIRWMYQMRKISSAVDHSSSFMSVELMT